jgi:methyl-accepting chemotaxis protein
MLVFKKLRYVIFFGYCIPVILLTLAAFLVTSNVKTVQEEQRKLNLSKETTDLFYALTIDINFMSSLVQNSLLNPQASDLREYRTDQQSYQQIIPKLEQLIVDEQQQQNLRNLMELSTEKQALDDQLLNLVNQGNLTEAIQIWKKSKYLELSDQVLKLVKNLNDREAEMIKIQLISQETGLNNLIGMIWIATGSSILLTVTLGGWIIAQSIQKLDYEAGAIASATTEIVTTIAQQEEVAVQQATALNQTTTSMDELGISARQSAAQATAAAASATQVLALAGNHQGNSELIDKGSLKEKMSQIQEQIIRLSENLSQIYNINNLLSDLANQTNILALNASVEAVRAGEHGKGFGVVASEIRKLADQSRTSANKIGALIFEIQNQTNATILVTKEGGEAVTEIGIAINDVTLNIQQISLNIKQQAIAVDQVIEAMNNLNAAAQETTHGISQAKVSTELLNQTARNLKDMV